MNANQRQSKSGCRFHTFSLRAFVWIGVHSRFDLLTNPPIPAPFLPALASTLP